MDNRQQQFFDLEAKSKEIEKKAQVVYLAVEELDKLYDKLWCALTNARECADYTAYCSILKFVRLVSDLRRCQSELFSMLLKEKGDILAEMLSLLNDTSSAC